MNMKKGLCVCAVAWLGVTVCVIELSRRARLAESDRDRMRSELSALRSATIAEGGNVRWVAPNGIGRDANTGLTVDSPWTVDELHRRGWADKEVFFLPAPWNTTAAETYTNVFRPQPWVPMRVSPR